jgi:cyclopropane fatty-acyl-phospholipid synthase-like methyltransferase
MPAINDSFSVASIRGHDRGYTAFHSPRYVLLLRLLGDLGASENTRILDIGRSALTSLIARRFGARVDSLGLERDGATDEGVHFRFDLNRTLEEASWRRDLPRYDVVVMAEVIEHLHTAPELVLAFIRTLVADGGRLVLQTPNAASLPKRIKLALGRNPYERIRTDASNPGHFREYTANELRQLAESSGFRTERCWSGYYFDARYARHRDSADRPQPVLGTLKNSVYPLLPPALREGITLVLRPA